MPDWPAFEAGSPPPAGAVWVLRAVIPAAVFRPPAGVLTANEDARAARILAPGERARFLVARSSLRRLLGRWLGMAPTSVPLRYGPDGKPELDLAPPPLHFNLAHAGDLVLLAFATDRAVGIDVERPAPRVDDDAIAKRFFRPCEHAELAAMAPADRRAAFFRTWTRKEALGKGTGEGMWKTLDRYTIPVTADSPLTLTLPGAGVWTLLDLAPAPNHIAAVAAPGTDWRAQTFTLAVPPSAPGVEPRSDPD